MWSMTDLVLTDKYVSVRKLINQTSTVGQKLQLNAALCPIKVPALLVIHTICG